MWRPPKRSNALDGTATQQNCHKRNNAVLCAERDFGGSQNPGAFGHDRRGRKQDGSPNGALANTTSKAERQPKACTLDWQNINVEELDMSLLYGEDSGALGRIRTPDPLIRSQVLYPAELSVRYRAI